MEISNAEEKNVVKKNGRKMRLFLKLFIVHSAFLKSGVRINYREISISPIHGAFSAFTVEGGGRGGD